MPSSASKYLAVDRPPGQHQRLDQERQAALPSPPSPRTQGVADWHRGTLRKAARGSRLAYRIVTVIGLLLAGGSAPAAGQQYAPNLEEVVVTAQRTGIPVWRVSSATTTLVLIGSIEGVAKQTKWDAIALTETLLKADRVMFPGMMEVSASPFSMIGYLIKFRRQANLPKGRSLARMLSPGQYHRLVALQKRGLLKAGFERRNPLHLSIALRNTAKGKEGYGPSASEYVRRAALKHKIRMVPIATVRAKSVANDFFNTPPEAYLPCLMDSVALLEAGPGAVRARSDAWAQRRVQAALASPAQKVQASCVPPAFQSYKPHDLTKDIRNLLGQRPITVAVLDLDVLARPAGVLDSLQAAGYDVRGPRWKN